MGKKASTIAEKSQRAVIEKLETLLKGENIDIPPAIKKRLTTVYRRKNTLLCVAEDTTNAIEILVDGRVIVMNAFSNGRWYAYTSEHTFTILGDIEYLSGQMINASSVMAETDVSLVHMSISAFEEWLQYDRQFYELVVYQVANKCYKNVRSLGNAKFRNSASQVLQTLVEMGHPSKEDNCIAMCSHEELAQRAGMSIRTVNRVLQELKAEQIVTLGYRKAVIDLNKAKNYLEEKTKTVPIGIV